MIVRKLRLERGWSQETLAELSNLSVRTIQRIERGGKASLESMNALAAAFGILIADLSTEAPMYQQNEISHEEREALEYVRDIKGFYSHAAVYAIVNTALVVANFLIWPDYLWFYWCALGWGLGVASHGLMVFEVFSLFGADWERKQVDKRLRQENRG